MEEGEKRDYKPHEFRPKEMREGKRNILLHHYDKNYKKLLAIPLTITIACVAVLLFSYLSTGEFFQKDVSIKGGVTVTIAKPYSDVASLEEALSSSLGTTVSARRLSEAGIDRGIIIDAGREDRAVAGQIIAEVESRVGPLSEGDYSVQVIGSSLGASFFRAVMVSMAAAFALMAAVVFLYFRFAAGRWILVPGIFIIWTVLVDIICTFAVISLLKVPVSTAGLAAFLLLIGYSVDTDILLTMRVLKGRQERIFDRILSAARTGVFMTLTGITAVAAGLVFTQSETIGQIMLILLVGLVFDLLHTWLANTGILRWYMERGTYGER